MGNATNLCSGITYTITVTDANNCTGTTTIQLTAKCTNDNYQHHYTCNMCTGL
ncbi:MAG: hypothetical protein IPO02_15280 [Bacteroidetes bacterium]|nr:hypothetical protein [Bacteroidota bacterium]